MMGTRKFFAAVLAGILALPLLMASAEAAEWRIERMSGNVQIHDGGSWVPLDKGRDLNAGDSIWTGRNGRILLMSDQGSVLLAPRSLVKIPAQALPKSFSVLFQTHGKVSAEVEKRRSQHFSIQTPYLAAVVKGTEFDVEIDKKQTRVSVSEGLVGVISIETGQGVDVPAGSTVSVAAQADGKLYRTAVTSVAQSSGGSSSTSGVSGSSGSSGSGSSGNSGSPGGSNSGSPGGSNSGSGGSNSGSGGSGGGDD